MGGGSISTGTGEFNFVAIESYLIESGKIKKLLNPASLIGTGPDILKKLQW